jgi:hypothetical protein
MISLAFSQGVSNENFSSFPYTSDGNHLSSSGTTNNPEKPPRDFGKNSFYFGLNLGNAGFSIGSSFQNYSYGGALEFGYFFTNKLSGGLSFQGEQHYSGGDSEVYSTFYSIRPYMKLFLNKSNIFFTEFGYNRVFQRNDYTRGTDQNFVINTASLGLGVNFKLFGNSKSSNWLSKRLAFEYKMRYHFPFSEATGQFNRLDGYLGLIIYF